MQSPRIKSALISVSDKTGLDEFARELSALGVRIFCTGGTRSHLERAGVPVQEVAHYTGFPEILDGRVKTLHPKVFGGILARHDHPHDLESLASHGITTFELVIVNLYPFERTIGREGVTNTEAVEQIDIGGPSLVRAAAKNYAYTTILCDPLRYGAVLAEIRQEGRTTLELRRELAADAFSRTAAYDETIAGYFQRQVSGDPLPLVFGRQWRRKAVLRYGENPHQMGAVYRDPDPPSGSVVEARQLHGKELSYNNYLDLDAALAIVSAFPMPCAAVVKHNNPCGVACARRPEAALEQALAGDPVSAFGSVMALNSPVTLTVAELLCQPGLFVEAIVAPGFEQQAIQALTTRPKWRHHVRLLEVGPVRAPSAVHIRQIHGGLLVQTSDPADLCENEWKVATQVSPSDDQVAELRFAWIVVRHVRSNAIVISRDQAVCGVGAGQMSRVDAVDIALRKAGPRAVGAVMASDAFFPFPDSIQKGADAGIRAIIQPGGSRNDEEVIAACDRHGLAMIVTGRRHFRH
jgi:phosphoribosylaminoimidazolecarboxamide formyltransferase/IMP cyclohydrolase